ncbi:S-type anion channel SLAH1-like [Syzygium oleosum]|uniref:S-type anion channel SLAH1-like n=1 Tax=Syzygium oleosum TaxID=219896 RepID=UPI0011D1A81C|nr:S-type anion channel SLAH1-like [Syzygium oleosum]
MESELRYEPPLQLVIDTSRTRTPDRNLVPITKPFKSTILTRLHAGYFRISLSLASQALLWKILRHPSTSEDSLPLERLSHVIPHLTFMIFWGFAVLVQISLSFLYILRCFFHFGLVRAEFQHHVGVNYLFAPWITWLVLLQSADFTLDLPKTMSYLVLWWVFAVPVILLDIKIYGQWFTTERRFLSTVANPTSQLSVVGNLVGAWAAAEMGWCESAVCMFSLGMAHYLVLFVTLYQRLSGGDKLPAMLRPVFFLFFAAPSMASLAWKSISGGFDIGSKMLFFLSLFQFTSLACRPALFKKSMRKFNVAWWAYSFPLTFLALASSEYAQGVKGGFASGLVLVLSALSFLVLLGLILLTALNTDRLFREDDPILHFDKGRS